MNTLTDLYQINGQPIPAPDAGVELTFTDLDSADSGRDESGVMHRIVVRSKVPTWSFCYTRLTAQEQAYLRSLLPDGGTFTFTHPDPDDPEGTAQCTAYLSGYTALWQGLPTGHYTNLKFSVISC